MPMIGQMNETTALVFLNAGNLLYVVCYAVKDVLWLRVFCVAAICAIMPYYIWGVSQPQMACIWWNLVFTAINLFWIVVILKQRQPPKMTVQQKQLFSDVFEQSCTPQEMLALLTVSSTLDLKIGDSIVSRSSNPNGLMLIDQGQASVVSEHQEQLATLSRGDFIGEMSFLTGEPAVADVLAGSEMKLIRWEKSELEKLFEGRPELKSVVNEIIGRDLVQKIISSEVRVPGLSVDSVVR